MDNSYLLDLINETQNRGGGLLLNFQDKPAVVVLTIERYNYLLNQLQSQALLDDRQESALPENQPQTPLPKAKVLVTGGAGYIGGHLVRQLILENFEVVVLDNLSSGKRENLHPGAMFVEGDLADENLLRDIFANHKFSAVFHMAASLEVEESVAQPEKYLQNNVINTAKLLSAMAEANVRKIIFSSTAAVYGELEQSPIAETARLHPGNPYGSSKLLAERTIKYFCDYLNFHAVVFRYFNACGFDPGAQIQATHQSHLIYNVMEVAKGNKEFLEVFGNDYQTPDGTCVRDYIHVQDIVKPHILALQKMPLQSRFEVYNIGTGQGHSVAEVVNCASEVLNKIIPMQIAARRPGDAPESVANNSKLFKDFGYLPKNSSLENILITSWGGFENP